MDETSVTYDDSVTLTATVENTETGAVPNGTVQFTVTPTGGQPISTDVEMAGGQAEWTFGNAPGRFTATAEYLGNSDFIGSLSDPSDEFAIEAAPSTLTLQIEDVVWNAAPVASGDVTTATVIPDGGER